MQVAERTDTKTRKKQEADLDQRLETFSLSLQDLLKEAITGRYTAGIDAQWNEDDNFYNGMESYENVVKGKTVDDVPKPNKTRTGADEFLNITRKYTDAASAKLGDMLLPTDDSNYNILPTPIPELKGMEGNSEDAILIDRNTMQPMQDPNGQPMTLRQKLDADYEEAERKCENAKTKIDDWLTECDYNGESRKMLEYCTRLGVGIMKGATPDEVKAWKVGATPEGLTIQEQIDIKPIAKCVSPYNFFPDPACGDNVHKGSYVFERDMVSRKELLKLAESENFIQRNIIKAINEEPQRQTGEATITKKGGLYEIFYMYGRVSKKDFIVAGGKIEEESDIEKQLDSVDAIVTLLHGRVIKVGLNPLPSGCFPYGVMPYTHKEGTWIGDGIPRQMRVPQKLINAAINATYDNHALSAGSIIFLRRNGITPQNGKWEITPRKVYFVDDDIEDIRQAVYDFQVQSHTNESIGLIEFALKMAEDVTGLPMLLQGQMGAAPDTLGGMQMLNNNASTVLRRLAKIYDDRITEVTIGNFYEYLIEYSENPDEKPDAIIDARGSSALVERDIQNQTIGQMLQLSLNPAYGIDPKKAFEEFLKSQRLPADTFMYSEEDLKVMQEQAAQQPPDPRMAVAEINAQAKQMQLKHQAQENQIDRQADRELMDMEMQLELLKMANAKDLSFEQIKADIQKTVMAIKNQREMFAAESAIKDQFGSGI